jgi:PadR family transcriptional regulator AphA
LAARKGLAFSPDALSPQNAFSYIIAQNAREVKWREYGSIVGDGGHHVSCHVSANSIHLTPTERRQVDGWRLVWYNITQQYVSECAMAAGTVSLRYFILGLLAQQPMSGYDIRRFLKGLGWLIGSPSAGSLYPILRTLHEEGFVTVETIPGLDRPPRKIYTITESGRQALQVWVDQPAVSPAPLKAFVMRLLLASSFSPAGLTAHLQQRQAQVAAHRDALGAAVGATQEEGKQGQFLAMDYALALATAELSWLDRTLSELSRQPLLEKDA